MFENAFTPEQLEIIRQQNNGVVFYCTDEFDTRMYAFHTLDLCEQWRAAFPATRRGDHRGYTYHRYLKSIGAVDFDMGDPGAEEYA